MSYNPFQPQGKSVGIVASSTPPTGVQAPAFQSTQQPTQYRIKIDEAATVEVAVGWGATAALAASNSALPSLGSATQCIVMQLGQTEVLTFPPGTFFSAYVSTGSPLVWVTPGDGI